ncbi:hypothetical protein ACQ4PT_060779 [Festuca glaucescens]
MVYRLEDKAGGPRRTPTPSLSDVPSAIGTETSEGEEEGERGASLEDEEIEEDSEVQQEEIDEEEEAEEELEPQGSSKSIWTRGIAGLPKEPANDDAKTLIKPNNKDNWSFVGTPGRLPNGVLGVLLKKYWPGLYRVKPLDETCLDKKLALKWEDYEAAHDESFGTRANVVITSFWEHVHGKPLTKLGAWKMSHKKTKVDKPGEEQYYGGDGVYYYWGSADYGISATTKTTATKDPNERRIPRLGRLRNSGIGSVQH